MKKLMKVFSIAMIASLVVGCATKSDIANIQTQIDDLKRSVAQVSSDAATAQSMATDAKAAAERADKYSQAANLQLGMTCFRGICRYM